jgi:hypothetical protein
MFHEILYADKNTYVAVRRATGRYGQCQAACVTSRVPGAWIT